MSVVSPVRGRARAALIQSPRLHVNSEGQALMEPHARLSATAASLRNGTLGPEDRHLLATMIERIAGGEDAATALGVKRAPGQRTLQTCAALAERDRLIRDAAARFLGGLSVAEQAHRLHSALSRYRATGWRRERICEQCPDRHLGSLREFLWAVLKQRDYVLTARSLRLILAAS